MNPVNAKVHKYTYQTGVESSIFILNYFQLQVSLAIKHLKFPIALLLFGTMVSIGLGLFEKLVCYISKKSTVNVIEVKEYDNPRNSHQLIDEYFEGIEKCSLHEIRQELTLIEEALQFCYNEYPEN